jgi:RNA polymerase sigma factor (sigma-70 family)
METIIIGANRTGHALLSSLLETAISFLPVVKNFFGSRCPMDLPPRGSVTVWLDDLREQDKYAAQELWNRYFAQLIPVARQHLHGLSRDADEEDIALSAMKSALLGLQNHQFPNLNDRTGLWPLLVTITRRKATNEIKRQRTQKRNYACEVHVDDPGQLMDGEYGPDFALRLADEIRRLVRALGDETLETIARLKLNGVDNDEIARQLGVSSRTVVRKLARIRQEWDLAG